MKHSNALEKVTIGRILSMAGVAALAVAFMVAPLQPAHAASGITVPPVPDNIKVEAGNKVFLVGHAVGTQNYVCAPSGAGFAFVLFTPQATLFDDDNGQIITHFFSPDPKPEDPAENGKIRATWLNKDSSRIWAEATATATHATDPNFVEAGAIAWVLLTADNTEDGPTGGNKLSVTTFVQRLNTHGGLAPSTGCASLADVGHTAFQPYTADYFFYHADAN